MLVHFSGYDNRVGVNWDLSIRIIKLEAYPRHLWPTPGPFDIMDQGSEFVHPHYLWPVLTQCKNYRIKYVALARSVWAWDRHKPRLKVYSTVCEPERFEAENVNLFDMDQWVYFRNWFINQILTSLVD